MIIGILKKFKTPKLLVLTQSAEFNSKIAREKFIRIVVKVKNKLVEA